MFRRHPEEVEKLVMEIMRRNGLETPLRQRRLMRAWNDVAGEVAARYSKVQEIRNQTLFVKVNNPALRAELQMRRTELVQNLNAAAGTFIINDIKLY